MSALKLVIFDVDGTLVDSQADIVRAMDAAFSTLGRATPTRADILSIVGLSLDEAMARLAPDLASEKRAVLVQAYKDAYASHRDTMGHSSPLYPGVQAVLEKLGARDEVLLGIATGKSRRGLSALLQAHGLERVFVTEQVSDFHPSKPHPAMLEAALAEAGVAAQDAVMVGDTSYDMDMAKAAGIFGIGVSWGYHPRAALTSAGVVLDDMAELPALLCARWGASA